ncbi:MAG: hypothetical protein GY851_20605 [bacterium]|nr:hypothetical protein [bacterium]
MSPDSSPYKPPKTLWMHVCSAYRRILASHTVSFYLVFAIFIVMLLSTQIVNVRHNPHRFAWVLILLFLFFFAVLYRAVVDLVEIARDHFRDRERVFQATLGDREFMEELGQKVADRREEP